MTRRHVVIALAVLASASLLAAPAAGQGDPPRMPWGAPDLQGVWDFRTITPLERPEELGDQEFLTAEEAAGLEQAAVDRDIRLWEAAPRRTEAGGNVGGYNNFWMDRGTNIVGNRRTSLIVDPPNGRIPPLSEDGQRRADERRERRAESPADSYLDRSAFDRCILGFNTGPPMTPAAYNQNMQLFQTPDHVVVLNEMVHDARIIPLDGRPRPGIESWTGESRRPVGGRHAGRRDRRLQPQAWLAGHDAESASDRALHARGCRDAALRVHDHGCGDVDRAPGRRRCRCGGIRCRCSSTPATRGTTRCPGSWAVRVRTSARRRPRRGSSPGRARAAEAPTPLFGRRPMRPAARAREGGLPGGGHVQPALRPARRRHLQATAGSGEGADGGDGLCRRASARPETAWYFGGLVRKGDLNPHGPKAHKLLRLARLPVPPLPRLGRERSRVYHPLSALTVAPASIPVACGRTRRARADPLGRFVPWTRSAPYTRPDRRREAGKECERGNRKRRPVHSVVHDRRGESCR